MKTLIPLSFVLATVFFITPTSVHALQPTQRSGDSIEVSPTFQEVTLLERDASASAKMTLTNNTSDTQTFEISPIVIQQFDQQGNVTFSDKPLSAENTPLASFITGYASVATVSAHAALDVLATIVNSQDLAPGGHYVAIVARLHSTQENKQVVLPAVSSFLLIRKEGGEQFHLSLAKTMLMDRVIFSLPTNTNLQFSNQGNVHVIPRGKIEITDIFHRLIAKGIINENSLYVFPNTQRVLSQSIYRVAPSLPLSLFKVNIVGYSQPGDVVFQQSGWLLYADPIGLFGLFVMIVMVIFVIVRQRRRKKKPRA